MTFNQKDKEKGLHYQTPLLKSNSIIDTEIINLSTEIDTNFMEFNRFYNDLKEFNRKIPTLTKKEYEKTKDDIHYKIQLLPGILNLINSHTEKLHELEVEIHIAIKEKLTVIKENLNPKVTEMPHLIQEIYEREKIVSLKLRNIKISESQLDDSLSVLQNRSDHIRESKILAKEVITNQVYLEKRKQDLEMIKKVCEQIKQITVMMGEEVKIQGEAIEKMYDEFESIRNNVQSSEDIISNAERGSRKKFKIILFLFLAIFIVVAAIVTTIVLIYIN